MNETYIIIIIIIIKSITCKKQRNRVDRSDPSSIDRTPIQTKHELHNILNNNNNFFTTTTIACAWEIGGSLIRTGMEARPPLDPLNERPLESHRDRIKIAPHSVSISSNSKSLKHVHRRGGAGGGVVAVGAISSTLR